MPSSSEILMRAEDAARHAMPIAVAWHAVLLFVALALSVGWRPSERLAGRLLVAPLISVALVSASFGSPFNAVAFAALAAALAILARRSSSRPVHLGPHALAAAGVAMIALGWVYPHFLAAPAFVYLYAAPLGVVPCATLYAVIGFALLGRGCGRPSYAYLLAAAGLFYGIIGVAQLGVWLDAGLIVGSVVLGVSTRRARRAEAGTDFALTG